MTKIRDYRKEESGGHMLNRDEFYGSKNGKADLHKPLHHPMYKKLYQ